MRPSGCCQHYRSKLTPKPGQNGKETFRLQAGCWSSPHLCAVPLRFVFWGCVHFGRGNYGKQPLRTTALPHVPPSGTCPLHWATTAMCLPCSSAPTEAVPSLKGDAPSPTSLCAPHPLPQMPPTAEQEQACWCHLSWPNPAAFGGFMVQSTPAEQMGAPSPSCPPGCAHPSRNSTSAQHPKACQKMLGELSHLGQGALDHSGDIRVGGHQGQACCWDPPCSKSITGTLVSLRPWRKHPECCEPCQK